MTSLELSPSYETSIKQPLRYAGFWIRALAISIDGAVLFTIFVISISINLIPLFIMHPRSMGDNKTSEFVADLLSGIINLTYIFGLTGSLWQATLGKRWLGIYVQTSTGQRLKPGRIFGRELFKFLSLITLFVGYMMTGWTHEKTALHDIMAKTRVVYGKKLSPLEQSFDGSPAQKIKSPATALIWSLLFSGGGQFYNGDWLKGAAFLIANIVLWIIWLGWIPWIWSIINAYNTASRRLWA